MPLRSSALALAIVIECAPGKAAAELDLDWQAPPDCPTEVEVRARIGELSPVDTADVELSVTARVEPVEGSRYRLTMDAPSGRRIIESAQCADLAEASALLVTLLVPSSVLDVPASAPDVSDRSTAEHEGAAGLASPVRGPVTDERGTEQWSIGVNLGGAIAVGALPGLAGGLEVGATLERRSLFMSLGVYVVPRSAGQLADQPTLGGTFRLVAMTGRLCWLFGPERFVTVGPCVSTQVGSLAGRGRGVAAPSAGRTGWFTVGPAAQLGMRIHRQVSLIARAELDIPIRRTEFGLEGIGVVHEPAPIQGRFSLGAQARF